MPKLTELSPALQAEARRILSMPTDTEAERIASVRQWHRFLDEHDVDYAGTHVDRYGTHWFKHPGGHFDRVAGE